ncbi:unnamed protein product, partial [Leptidea sinapis]
FSM